MRVSKGIIRAYDATNHKADVLLVGSLSRVALGVPVAHHVGPEVMTADRLCGVMFFGEGDAGVVVCTFDGSPPAWVTSALIKDGEIVKGDLAWDPTVYSAMNHTTGDLTLTVTPTWYSSLGSHTVTVPTGKTFRVALIASVQFYCTAYTQGNFDRVQVYRDGAPVGQPLWLSIREESAGGVVALPWTEDLTATATYKIHCWKDNDVNTERAVRGHFMVQYWEVPS